MKLPPDYTAADFKKIINKAISLRLKSGIEISGCIKDIDLTYGNELPCHLVFELSKKSKLEIEKANVVVPDKIIIASILSIIL